MFQFSHPAQYAAEPLLRPTALVPPVETEWRNPIKPVPPYGPLFIHSAHYAEYRYCALPRCCAGRVERTVRHSLRERCGSLLTAHYRVYFSNIINKTPSEPLLPVPNPDPTDNGSHPSSMISPIPLYFFHLLETDWISQSMKNHSFLLYTYPQYFYHHALNISFDLWHIQRPK